MCFIVFFVFSHRPVPSHPLAANFSRGSNKFCHHKHQKHPPNGAKAPPPRVHGTLHGGVLIPQVAGQQRSSEKYQGYQLSSYPNYFNVIWKYEG